MDVLNASFTIMMSHTTLLLFYSFRNEALTHTFGIDWLAIYQTTQKQLSRLIGGMEY